jgi:hypothetical protein
MNPDPDPRPVILLNTVRIQPDQDLQYYENIVKNF